MKKRISYVVLFDSYISNSLIALVEYFVLHQNTNKCVAIVKLIQLKEDLALLHPNASHLLAIVLPSHNCEEKAILVDNIKEKLLFLDGNRNKPCVARLPNMYKQSS